MHRQENVAPAGTDNSTCAPLIVQQEIFQSTVALHYLIKPKMEGQCFPSPLVLHLIHQIKRKKMETELMTFWEQNLMQKQLKTLQ